MVQIITDIIFLTQSCCLLSLVFINVLIPLVTVCGQCGRAVKAQAWDTGGPGFDTIAETAYTCT